MRDEKIRKQDGRIERGIKLESIKRDILSNGAIMGLGRNLVLGNIPGIHKDNTS